MTFKANWEKSHTQHDLADDVIIQMLEVAYPDNKINRHEIIAGGCANINIKADLAGLDSPIILRVYLRDPKAAYKEQKLAQKLAGKVPLPQIYRIAEIAGYTFAIEEFIPGITLRDLLLNDKEHNVEPIMFKVGNILSHIAATKFDSSGFLNENLEISEPITQDGFIEFCQNALNDRNVKSVLSSEQRKQIYDLIKNNAHLFPDGSERNLVHADFDPANIMVKKTNTQLEISGILDWEFAFSGSTLSDVANMLRYAHHMPKSYEDAFLSGLTSGGYSLPENWRPKVHMLNLLSLLDCLQRSNPETQSNQIADIRELIRYILHFLMKNNQPHKNIINTLETDRLILRTWQEQDLQPMFKINQDPKVMEYFPNLQDLETTKKLIDKANLHFDEHGFTLYAATRKDTGEFIGFIGLLITDFDAPFTPATEIAWRLSPKHWRQGFATEGAKAVLDHAFRTLNIPEIVSFAHVDNIKSRRVMEKIGLQHDVSDDFDHPKLADDSPLKKHVLYRLNNEQYFAKNKK